MSAAIHHLMRSKPLYGLIICALAWVTPAPAALPPALLSKLTQRHLSQVVRAGVLVSHIRRDSNLWAQGLRANEIILAVNRRTVTFLEDFVQIISSNQARRLDFRRGRRTYTFAIR